MDYDLHFENACRWINDPDISENLIVGDFPLAKLTQKEWFNNVSIVKPNPSDIVFAIELLNGTHLGTSGIHGIDWRNGVASTGSYIGEKSEQGHGYGTEAAQVRAWYCFNVLGLRLLTSEFFGGNERSRKMQAKAGYLEAGRMPARFWKRGRYVDDCATYLTRERWLEISGGKRTW